MITRYFQNFFNKLNFFKKNDILYYQTTGFFNVKYFGTSLIILDYVKNTLYFKVLLKFQESVVNS